MQKITCKERDQILLNPKGQIGDDWGVASGFTDLIGEFGQPRIETTWMHKHTGMRVRDERYPNPRSYSAPDAKPCEHWLEKEVSND